MGCWGDLNLKLKLEILQHVPLRDIFNCQSVSRSFREVAIDIFYQSVTLSSKEQALNFLKGQLQAIEPRGGRFVYMLNLTNVYSLRNNIESGLLPIRLFATSCPNVQYLLGDSGSWQFWAAVKELTPSNFWPELKHIPYNNGTSFSSDYFTASLVYRNSLTNVTFQKNPPGFDVKTPIENVFAFIQETYPKIESLELFNRKIKHVFELDHLNTYLPNLRALLTNRGKNKFMLNPVKGSYKNLKQPIVPHRNLEHLDIGLPKLDLNSIHFIALKFPCVKTFHLVLDKVANILGKDHLSLNILLMYLFTRQTFSLVLPVDTPVFILGEFYSYYERYFSVFGHRLTIKYGPNRYNTPRKTNEQYCPNVILTQEGRGIPGMASLEYDYFTNDEHFLDVTNQVFEYIGEKLNELDIDMSGGYIHTLGSELMNGYFLDSLIFKYCTHLQHLRLQYFHLVRCNLANAMPVNNTIWQLYIISSQLYNGAILDDISLRLTNLKHVCLDSCTLTNEPITNIILSHSQLERLMIVDTLKRRENFVRWVVIDMEKGRQVYRRSEPGSAILVPCDDLYFSQNYLKTTDYMIYIRCKSVRVVDLRSQQFHISCELNIA